VTDSKISALAARSQNFGYLLSDKVLPHEQLLVEFGARAELVVFADPNSALVKARQFVETLAREMVRFGRVPALTSRATRTRSCWPRAPRTSSRAPASTSRRGR
jgi:hypothetical protein